jgi:Tfp pilus assembly protein PilF
MTTSMFSQIPALIDHAVQHFQRGDLPQAAELLRQVLGAQPRNFDALHILGVIRALQGNPAEAIELFKKALSVNKRNSLLHFNLAKALSESGLEIEALLHHRKATQLAPGHAEAWLNYGKSLFNLEKLEEAFAAFNKALEINPLYAQAHNNKGLILAELGQIEAAIACFNQAITAQPALPDAHWNQALQHLKLGNYAAGWAQFDYRWQMDEQDTPKLASSKPLWTGERSSQPLLIWGEQGIGDQVLYGSILPDMVTFPQKKLVALDKRLIPLFKRSIPGFEFMDLNEVSDTLDFAQHLPMGSLPRYFRKSREDFKSAQTPFLLADPTRSAALRQKIHLTSKLVCGVSWWSNRKSTGKNKSIRLEELLAPLASDKLHFVNLQYGDTAAERNALRAQHGITVQNVDEVDNFNDIDGLAALIQACDVVITTSNTTAHLAGALGKETLLLLPFSKGKLWYWAELEGHNPWYPSIRMFAQEQPGQWQVPLERIKKHIENSAWN